MKRKQFGIIGTFGGKLLVRVLYSNHVAASKAMSYFKEQRMHYDYGTTYKGKIIIEYAATQEQMLYITSFAIEGRINKLERLAAARRNGKFQPVTLF